MLPILPFAFSKSPLSAITACLISVEKIDLHDAIISIRAGRIKTVGNNPLLNKTVAQIPQQGSLITLGKFNGQRILIHSHENPLADSEQDQWQSLRALAMNLPIDIASIIAHASAVAHWHSHHQFCGLCGSKTKLGKEHSRLCLNQKCKHAQFPRVDPAVIMSVINENDEILLGRQASWRENTFSVIAGFLSHGETLEDCVAREVLEETGVVVSSVEYIASQPWPFPGSIMLGFRATAKKQSIVTNDDELEEAMWISREELQLKRDNKEIFISPRFSISRYLIDLWIEGASD